MPSKLKLSRAEAEATLRDRIERGNEVLRNLRTNNPIECMPIYDNWREYNVELLGRMFSRPVYKSEYLDKVRYTAAPQPRYRRANAITSLTEEIRCLSSLLDRLPLIELEETQPLTQEGGTDAVIFIGHGHSAIWKDLRDFIRDRIGMPLEEFNRVSPAGIAVTERLAEMLNRAHFAFLVLTGEDELTDGTLHARENVIHEAGLFQGRLGFRRAIILLEEGCQEFSNIHGLGQIRFPTGNIAASFEEIRQVLEREQLIASGRAALDRRLSLEGAG
jgi:hypothetical protein